MSYLTKIKQGLRAGFITLGVGLVFVSPAHAATTTYTVTTTNAGAGTCDASNNCTTLNAALTAANALAASAGDDISVVFQAGVTGSIDYSNGSQRMLTGGIPGGINNASIYGNGGNEGAVFYINANRPLTLDFGSRVSAGVSTDTLITSMLFINSSNVKVQNFDFGRGINSAATGIVIGGNAVGTVIRNGVSQTALVPFQAMDFCMAILDGANSVTVSNYICDGGNLSGLVLNSANSSAAAGISNITLDTVTFRNNNGGAIAGDIRVASENSAYPGAYTTVTNMDIKNSSFSSTNVANSIIFRGGSDITNFTVEGSTFTGTGVRGIYAEDSPDLGFGVTHLVNTTGLTIKNNTFTGTAEMVRLYALAPVNNNNTFATHDGLTITGNTIDGATCSTTNACGLVHLAGDPGKTIIKNTKIDGNNFLNQVVTVNGCGIYIHSGGPNNIVSNNVFNGDVSNATPKALHAIYSDALGNPSINRSGWTLATNSILNYQDGNGPILLNSATNTEVYGNTFGLGTTGAAAGALDPETAGTMFVTNISNANFNIQTWRPTVAYYGNGKVIITVAPVDPVAGGNSLNEPTSPVSIDVFYTSTDKADVYLGRIAGTHSQADGPVTYTFPNAGVGAGAVRLQVTEAAGTVDARSSQYSASVTMLPLTNLEARGRSGGGAMGGGVLVVLAGLALLRRRALAASLMALAGVLMVSNANAADGNGSSWTDPIYFGAKAGGLVTDFDADKFRDRVIASDSTIYLSKVEKKSSHFGYGAWLGYALNENWGLELSYTGGADERVQYKGYVPSLQAALDAGKPELIGYGASYLASLRYQHELSQNWFLSPHAGVGMTRTHQSLENLDTGETARFNDRHFSYNAGLGIHYVLSPDWSIGLAGDFYQVPKYGMYGMVSAVLEWRVPSAFRSRREPPPVVSVVAAPVSVVPVPATPTAPAVPPVPPVPPVSERIVLKSVNFDSSSHDLTPESREILMEVAATLLPKMQASPDMQVEISGHADSTGVEDSNLRLSLERAQAVADFLVSQKLDGSRLHILGFGSSMPIAPNNTIEGRAMNRRADSKVSQ